MPICWRRGRDKRADAPSGGQLGWSGQNLQQIILLVVLRARDRSADAASQQPRAVVADRSGTTTLEGGD